MRRKNHYSISEFLNNAYSLVLTKIFFRQCRLVRYPVVIRGRKSLSGCKNLTTGKNCRFDLDGDKKTLKIGNNCEFGDNTHIVALKKVVIGNNVLIASKVFISDCSHGCYSNRYNVSQDLPETSPNDRKLVYEEVCIGDNVWIGENAVILLGTHIGGGCIIGANSVVTRDIPDNSMVIGHNQIIKKFNLEKHVWEKI